LAGIEGDSHLLEVTMRKLLQGLLAVGLVLGPGQGVLAADDAAAILAKAIKAHQGKAKGAITALEFKSKGKVEMMGGLEFTQTVKVQMPNKFKEVVELTIQGQKITQTVGFDGKQGWLNINGMDVKLDKLQETLQEAAYMIQMGQLVGIKGKGIEVSLVGEDQVEGKAVVGIRLSKKGHQDVSMYFDKKTWLLTKIERRAYDLQSQQEVKEERIITEYQVVDGRPMAKKALVKKDDKKAAEIEITQTTFADKFDDSEFAKP
jgi:hypothetical protein